MAWSRDSIIQELRDLRVGPGEAVLVHASMRAIGPVEGGADTVIDALLDVVGPEGTLAVPAFNGVNRVPEGDDGKRASVEPRKFVPGPSRDQVGILAERVAGRSGACASAHPSLAFAALGRGAAFLTAGAPFHYPLGSNSPLARLHQLNARILLLGVDHRSNSTLHLAENWADSPYARRKSVVLTPDDTRVEMEGSPECSAGFRKIEPILRQARILKTGLVGDAPSQSMLMRHVVSMAVDMLRGSADSLLCDDPTCRTCTLARRFTTKRES